MSSLFDDNNEEERQEQKLYEFYEVFSLEVRRQLLAKNIPIIQNVYDVLYPQTKNQLLAKNVPSDLNINSTAESVRNALVAKLVEENINIDAISENFRKQLLSKNILADSSRQLQDKIDKVRKNLLSKNKNSNPNTIDSISESQRRDLISKNAEPLNRDKEIEDNNISFRENNLTKNVSSENTLNQQSEEFRKNNIHKNIESNINLERQGEIAREQNLAKNQNSISKLDSIADEKRRENESKNTPKEVNGLDVDSESFRDNNTYKNIDKTTSIEDFSVDIRKNNLSKNDSIDGSLLEDSDKFRKQDLSKNIQSNSDLLSDSQVARDSDLSKNAPKESNLLDFSEEARLNDISKNKESKSDLLSDSNDIRKDDLSKNTPSKGDLLTDSEGFRGDNLSNNTINTSDISLDNASFREDNLTKNVVTKTDLESESEDYRLDDLSKNKSTESDLLSDSSMVRNGNMSNNTPSGGDLLTDSKPTRDDLLANTIPVVTDLEFLSQNPRTDLLSQNVPNPSDLLVSGIVPRTDLLSQNVSNPSDLLVSGIVPRTDLLSQNVSNPSDLLISSVPTRNDLLAINVPHVTDLLVDSQTFRNNELSQNVPSTGDLLSDSVPYYVDNLSSNVPTAYDILNASQVYLNSNLSSNVPTNSDLLTDSQQTLQDNLAPNVPSNYDLLTGSNPYLQDNLSANIPNTSDLLAESIPIRNDLVSQNQPGNSNLLTDSSIYRDNLVAQNANNELGATFEGAGTFSYLGVSKVALQGLVIRTFLTAKNRNDYVIYKNEYSRSTARALTDQVSADGLPLKSYPNANPLDTLQDAISRQIGGNRSYTEITATQLQKTYGLHSGINTNTPIGGGYFGVNSINPQGGSFVVSSKAASTQIINVNYLGSTTNYIRNYNISRNLYNLSKDKNNLYNTSGIKPVVDMAFYTTEITSNNDLGFQELISKTIGSFSNPSNSVSAQQFGNLIPNGSEGANGGYLYLNSSAEKLLRKEDVTLGTPESMMQKTIAGNPLQEPAFDTGNRGVKHIVKTIRNNPNVKMSVNYDPQNTHKYVISETNPSGIKYGHQRFTIANPYSPPSAKSLTFSLKNYSSGDLMYLPPYIDSFSDSHTANWNEINFLGRPEPIYTYNNSKRDGSISFFVLTDFSQIVLMGRTWGTDMNKIEKNVLDKDGKPVSFANKASYNVAGAIFDASGLIERYGKDSEKIKELTAFKASQNTSTTEITTGSTEQAETGDKTANNAGNEPETAEQKEYKKLLDENRSNIASQINTSAEIADEDFIYALASQTNKNIYDFMTSNSTPENGGEISSTPGDTLARLDAMIEGTIFQPAYFSGSKVDFLQRMDFLAKLTKPAKATAGSGYSFTQPPVAHIKLGNWWIIKIVVKSVSVDYTDSPWTLDKGRVQPLWAKVTLSFDFVGRYGGEGAPVLSTDSGGVYSS